MDDRQLIEQMVEKGSINTLFQPVVSIPTRSILGFEAFSEGVAPGGRVEGGRMFSPDTPPQTRLELDRLCREKALRNFKSIADNHKSILLFLNLDLSVLECSESAVDHFAKQTAAAGVPPERVIVEAPPRLLESLSPDVETFYRRKGVMLSVDNVDMNDAVFGIFAAHNVDFIKVNRSFFADADERAGRMLKRLVSFAGEMGASVIAQCVESEEESIFLLKNGIGLQQGYYYTKDEVAETDDPARMFFGKIRETYNKFLAMRREAIRDRKARFEALNRTASRLAGAMAKARISGFEQGVREIVRDHEAVISAFVIDPAGVQLTTRPRSGAHAKKTRTLPESSPGFDHGGRDYYLYIEMGYDKFVTRPFDSPGLGLPACLIAMPFYGVDGRRYILCLEFPHPG